MTMTVESVFRGIIDRKDLPPEAYAVLQENLDLMAKSIIIRKNFEVDADTFADIISDVSCAVWKALSRKEPGESVENPKGYLYMCLSAEITNHTIEHNSPEYYRFNRIFKEILRELENEGEVISNYGKAVKTGNDPDAAPLLDYEIVSRMYTIDLHGIREGVNWTQDRKARLREAMLEFFEKAPRPVDSNELLSCLAARLGIADNIFEPLDETIPGSGDDESSDESAGAAHTSTGLSPESEEIYRAKFDELCEGVREKLSLMEPFEHDIFLLSFGHEKKLREIAFHKNAKGTSNIDYYLRKPENKNYVALAAQAMLAEFAGNTESSSAGNRNQIGADQPEAIAKAFTQDFKLFLRSLPFKGDIR